MIPMKTICISMLLCLSPLLAATSETETGAWITSQGGRFATEAGRITLVDLGSTWVTDVDMLRIAQLDHLRTLDLSHTLITDVGLEHLKGLRNVSDLSLYYAEYLTDSGLAHIVDWKNLQRLNLKGTRVTSKVFEHLAHLTGLRSLDISYTAVDDDGFEELAALTKLEKLAMGANRLSGACLAVLKLLPALTSLDVGGMQWVDSGIWGLPLTEANLRQIGALKQLKSLSLNGANLTDRGADRPGQPEAIRKELKDLSALKGLVNLEVLDLSRTPVTAESLEPLKSLPKLRELRLGLASHIDDSAAALLAGMKNLKVVYVEGTQLSTAALTKLPARDHP
jgi:Leucine-rich repeat (LRR) protein